MHEDIAKAGRRVGAIAVVGAAGDAGLEIGIAVVSCGTRIVFRKAGDANSSA